ncbi:solute carrier family 35 member F2 isoform X2 [Hyalella azteca]|uniref:Solute carrier family 35 member F2 isoform X2 n=1 Tax=Hyalella azteca TaxID=294128 RepID=A0A8B7PJS3_HYAAZ|nr:solute carrier family 35 member F2 isoform X2 [Hyalella azteca]
MAERGGMRRTSLNYNPEASETNNGCCLSTINNSLPELGRWSIWRALLLGQIASLLICVTAACCHLLNNNYHRQLPAAVGFINYALLCLVYTTWLACRAGEGSLLSVVRARGYKYFILAAIDVEANYLVLRAYQYTSVTSVQLLDCFVVPVVLALSWLFLKVRYKLVHVLGVGLCLLGVGCLVWANVEDGKADSHASERFLGDMLCLGGATLYGISNVAQEYVIKTYDSVEFLGMMGLFGSVINGAQLGILERQQVGSVRWDTWPVLALVGGFSAAQFLFYVIAPCVLRATSATALNLALFTADFYILITGIALFGFKQFHPLYFLSYLLVVTGVVVFVIKPTPINTSGSGYYSSSGGHEVELTTTPGTTTSSVGGAASFPDWPPLPPEIRGCPDYPYPHSHSSDFRPGQEYPSTPPSPPQQFRSLPRPQRREAHPGQPGRGRSQQEGDMPDGVMNNQQQRAATLHRPPRQLYRSNGPSSSTHELGDVRC